MAGPEDLQDVDVARRLLSTRDVLRRVASVTASAQPAPTVDRARATSTAAEQKLTQLVTQRAQLTSRYQQQLLEIDGLKKQKRSWRRDRELNAAQANANETATRLTALDKQLATAQQTLATARKAIVTAIDAELAAGATGARADQLAKLRAQLVPSAPAPKKIVIPDAEIDPLADPEELERQAAAIMAAETQLEAQRKGLAKQHDDLVHVASIRQAHDRAGELAIREDDTPQRGAPRSSTRGFGAADTAGAPQEDSAGGNGGGGGSGSGADLLGTDRSTFETAAVALGEVIDRSTIDGMLRAQRSGDPKQRAEAAAQARDAVAKRLELLKKKRAMIEARAKQLRKSK
jgi:hypothetical protein